MVTQDAVAMRQVGHLSEVSNQKGFFFILWHVCASKHLSGVMLEYLRGRVIRNFADELTQKQISCN